MISSIFHVDHEYDDDDEPWPIVIESFDGTTHEVALRPGEMLFYEVGSSIPFDDRSIGVISPVNRH